MKDLDPDTQGTRTQYAPRKSQQHTQTAAFLDHEGTRVGGVAHTKKERAAISRGLSRSYSVAIAGVSQ